MIALPLHRRVRVAWVGGPPGRTMVKIRRRLSAMGVDIVREFPSSFTPMSVLPDNIDAVLFNHEMASHGMGDVAKAKAKARGIPIIGATIDTTRTILNLKNRGLIPVMRPEPPEVDDDDDDDDEDDKPLTHNPFAAVLREAPPPVEAKPPVTSHVATPPARADLPSSTTPVHELRTTNVDGFEVREVSPHACIVRHASFRGSPRAPVLVLGEVFISTSDAARFLGADRSAMVRALQGSGSVLTLNGERVDVRRATYDETVKAMPRIADELRRSTERRAVVEADENEQPATPAKEETVSEAKVVTLPAHAAPPATTTEAPRPTTLREEIDECLSMMVRWPNLRRHLYKALADVENNNGGKQ